MPELPSYPPEVAYRIAIAIKTSFDWQTSPEGWSYWAYRYNAWMFAAGHHEEMLHILNLMNSFEALDHNPLHHLTSRAPCDSRKDDTEM